MLRGLQRSKPGVGCKNSIGVVGMGWHSGPVGCRNSIMLLAGTHEASRQINSYGLILQIDNEPSQFDVASSGETGEIATPVTAFRGEPQFLQ